MQGLTAESPYEFFQARPGPRHEIESFPSPGEYVSVVGVAVVVTVMTPTDVGMKAVMLTGFQIASGTQNHVPTLTTILSIGGAVLVRSMLTNRETFCDADSAARGAASFRNQ